MLFMPCNWLKASDSAADLLDLILWLLSHGHLLSAHNQCYKQRFVLLAAQIVHTIIILHLCSAHLTYQQYTSTKVRICTGELHMP